MRATTMLRVPAIDSSILVCRGPKHEFVALVGAQVTALDFEIDSGLGWTV